MDAVCSFIVSREQYDGYSVQCAEGSVQIAVWSVQFLMVSAFNLYKAACIAQFYDRCAVCIEKFEVRNVYINEYADTVNIGAIQ